MKINEKKTNLLRILILAIDISQKIFLKYLMLQKILKIWGTLFIEARAKRPNTRRCE